jgi:hypothetical protein
MTFAEKPDTRQDPMVEYARRQVLADAPWAAQYFDPAFAGDEEAARFLVTAAQNHHRGLLAVVAYFARMPAPVLRAIVSTAWGHDHRYLMQAAGERVSLVRSVLKAAEVPIPDLPETITVYRGGLGDDPRLLVRGLSWTLSFEVAAWFAHRFAGKHRPLVISAEMPRASVIYFCDGRSEQEVVFNRAPRRWTHIPAGAATQAAHDKYEREKREAMMAELASYKRRDEVDLCAVLPL